VTSLFIYLKLDPCEDKGLWRLHLDVPLKLVDPGHQVEVQGEAGHRRCKIVLLKQLFACLDLEIEKLAEGLETVAASCGSRLMFQRWP
jgi:hypothetical protein